MIFASSLLYQCHKRQSLRHYARRVRSVVTRMTSRERQKTVCD